MPAHQTAGIPRMYCPHCHLSTRADMPRCLYCGYKIFEHLMPKPAKPKGDKNARHSPAAASARPRAGR